MNRFFKERLWLLYTVLASLTWGFWGVMTKFISADISPLLNHFLFTLGMLLTLPFIIPKCRLQDFNLKGVLVGVGTGLLAVTGNICVYQSFSAGGLASVVIPLTNLYPMLTILIGIFVFGEKLHWMNGIGILLIVPAIIMLSGNVQLLTHPLLFMKNSGLEVWLVFTFISILLYSIFSASQKIIAKYITAGWSFLSFVTATIIASVCFLSFGLIDFHFSAKTLFIGTMAGAVDGLGVLAVFAAYRAQGKAAQVSSIAAMLQQLFTIVLAMAFLNEKLEIIGITGIALAIMGSLLLSVQRKG